MNKRIQYIQHQGREIIFLDYSNLEEEEYLQAIKETEEKVLAHSNNPQKNLNLVDVTGSPTTAAVIGAASKLIAKIGSRDLLVALIGISGMKKVVARAFSKNYYFANSVEEAKDWLVKEAEIRDKKNII